MKQTLRKQTKTGSKGAPAKKKSIRAAVKSGKARTGPLRNRKARTDTAKNAGHGKRREEILNEFKAVINIPRGQLERWLATPESQKLRFSDEPKGSPAGQTILKLLVKRRNAITSEDIDYMRTVIEFIRRGLLKRPKGDIVASNWRYKLMNLGHDPTKRMKRMKRKVS